MDDKAVKKIGRGFNNLVCLGKRLWTIIDLPFFRDDLSGNFGMLPDFIFATENSLCPFLNGEKVMWVPSNTTTAEEIVERLKPFHKIWLQLNARLAAKRHDLRLRSR